jgi:hypothetical protein
MVILKLLDFSGGLLDILPQPFVLNYKAGDATFRHIPDYLVWRAGSPPNLINVKPKKFWDAPKNQQAFASCVTACAELGWSYDTEGEPPPVYLANVTWLAGYRRPPPQLRDFAEPLIQHCMTPNSIGEVIAAVGSPALSRPVLFYLLWTRQLEFNTHERLTDRALVWNPTMAG